MSNLEFGATLLFICDGHRDAFDVYAGSIEELEREIKREGEGLGNYRVEYHDSVIAVKAQSHAGAEELSQTL